MNRKKTKNFHRSSSQIFVYLIIGLLCGCKVTTLGSGDKDLDETSKLAAEEEGEGKGAPVNCPAEYSDRTKYKLLTNEDFNKKENVKLEAGNYFVHGPIDITNPIVIQGAGSARLKSGAHESAAPLTKITFCIKNNESGFLVRSPKVTIRDMEIEILLTERLRESDGTGASGTAITVGRFLDPNPANHPLVSKILLKNLALSRATGSYTATALALMGNVKDVTVEDIYLENKHSLGLLMHWGGILDSDYGFWGSRNELTEKFGSDCKTITSPEVFVSQEEADSTRPTPEAEPLIIKGTQKCRVKKSFHVRDVRVKNLRSRPNSYDYTSYLINLSSVYNVTIQDVGGNTGMPVLILAGDEAHSFAGPDQKDLINSNILISGVRAGIYRPKGITMNGIFLGTSAGGSKFPSNLPLLPGQKAKYETRVVKEHVNFELRDMITREVKDHPKWGTDQELLEAYRNLGYGIFALSLRGKKPRDVRFINIDMGELGLNETFNAQGKSAGVKQSVGIFLRYTKNLFFDKIKLSSFHGMALYGSAGIEFINGVLGSLFGDRYAQRGPDSAMPMAFGMFDEDFKTGQDGFPSTLSIATTSVDGYGYGVGYSDTRTGGPDKKPCSRMQFGEGNSFNVTKRAGFGHSCIPGTADFYIFAGQSNAMGIGRPRQISEWVNSRDGFTVPNAKIWINRKNIPLFYSFHRVANASRGTFEDLEIGVNTIQYPTHDKSIAIDRFGPEASFAKMNYAQRPKREQLILKFARGSTALTVDTDWASSAKVNLFDEMAIEARTAVNQNDLAGKLRCFVWVQGEADRRLWARAKTSAEKDALLALYKKNFTKLASAARTFTQSPDAKVVVVKLSPVNVDSDPAKPELDPLLPTLDMKAATNVFRKMQEEIVAADGNAALVSADGLKKKGTYVAGDGTTVIDNVHYTSPSYKVLGERIYDACH